MAAICREFLRSFRLRPLIREKSRLAVYRRRLKSDITLAYEKIPRFRNSGNDEMCSRGCITDRTAALRGLVSTVSDGAVCYLIRLHFDRTSMFPEFRKHGRVYPSIYSELTAEAILTNRDSAAKTPRTSFGCFSRYRLRLPSVS